MTRPTVATLHYTCPPVVGGVEVLISVHSALFAEHRYPTRVITGKGEPFRGDVPVKIISSLYSKDPALLGINEELDSGVVSERFHAAADGIYEALSSALAGVDVAIVHNAFTLHFNLPMTVALHRMIERKEGPRFVAWCHDVSWTNGLYLPKMRDAFPWHLLKRPLEGVSYVAVSASRQSELAELLDLPPERFLVIPAGVDPAVQLKLAPETVALVRQLDLLGGELLMLAPVRITKRKNLEMSIRITHALIELGVGARLVVTGPPGPHNIRSGDYVDELRRLRSELGVEREVVFLFEHVGGITPIPGPSPLPGGTEMESPSAPTGAGEGGYPVTDRMMWDLYSISDLLLFSSAQEGFGIPLLEAGLFKLPVFCSNIPPFREIGLDAVRYFELDERPETIAPGIRAWMERDEVYRLRRRVLSNYSWDSLFEKLMEPLVTGR